MPISYVHSNPADAKRFVSSHWVHVPLGGDRRLFTLTGIVLIDFKGAPEWRRDTLNLNVPFPKEVLPPGKWFQIEHWAPFVTLQSIFNQQYAFNAGWAVDEFSGPGAGKVLHGVGFSAQIAIRDTDGFLYRVGYSLTLSGRDTDPPMP